MSDLRNDWNDASGIFSDTEERKVLFATLDSFRQYRRVAHRNVTHRRRQNFYALPLPQRQLLAAPPFNFLSTLEQVDDAIDANADIAIEILKTGLESFGFKDEPGPDSIRWHGEAKNSDMDKARSTIRQFYRDWSSEGAAERRTSYGPVLEDIHTAFVNVPDRGDIRVLVPGAGLGRLVLEFCRQGYDVEGNEISYHQLIASNWILNHCEKAEQFTLYPFASDFSNVVSRADQLRGVKIPDVHPATALAGSDVPSKKIAFEKMSMTAADFIELYGNPKNKDAFDAVATVFFLDTTQNVIRYIRTVHHCLKTDGIWSNNGPLLWHFDSRHQPEAEGDDDEQPTACMNRGSIELSVDEVLKLVRSMGFEVDDRGIRDEGSLSGYIQNPHSMLQNSYRTSHWVARKIA